MTLIVLATAGRRINVELEMAIIGFVVGLAVGSILANWSLYSTLKYKAETKIDMCFGGKFYTVRENEDRNV